ncbi:MAG: glycosyltransferase, partial [Gammaproteobacteria bacterium]|nr:glycosyltransferase [Gammaproteobacteria bacterium]
MTLPDKSFENADKLKILHVISHYELGGAEKCTFELSRLFDGRVEMGVAAVLGNDSSEVGQSLTQTARENGITIFNGVGLPWKFGGFLATAFRLRRIVRDFRPDIVHLNTELPEFAYVLCLSIDTSLKRIPVIRTIHNTVLWSRWERLGMWCEKKLDDTPVIYVSDVVRDCFQKWRNACGLKPVTSGLTIYNPITVPLYREHLINLRIQQKEIRLLFAGRFEFQKGCDLLPEIM